MMVLLSSCDFSGTPQTAAFLEVTIYYNDREIVIPFGMNREQVPDFIALHNFAENSLSFGYTETYDLNSTRRDIDLLRNTTFCTDEFQTSEGIGIDSTVQEMFDQYGAINSIKRPGYTDHIYDMGDYMLKFRVDEDTSTILSWSTYIMLCSEEHYTVSPEDDVRFSIKYHSIGDVKQRLDELNIPYEIVVEEDRETFDESIDRWIRSISIITEDMIFEGAWDRKSGNGVEDADMSFLIKYSVLNAKQSAASGLGVGSDEEEVLAFYREPAYLFYDGDQAIYYFALNSIGSTNHLCFVVDQNSKKVTQWFFTQEYHTIYLPSGSV